MRKVLFLCASLGLSTSCFAGLADMMKIYNDPSIAPKNLACKGDKYCNGFISLAKQWKDIPNNYRYKGEWDIKDYARQGITYDDQGRNIGLHSGFYFRRDQTQDFISGADTYIENTHMTHQDHEGGLAVLLYIEDKNGWAKD